MFRNANPSNFILSLLEGKANHLLIQPRSDLAKQELHVESLNKCIGELYRRKSRDWRHRTHNTDLLNLDERKFDCKKKNLWKNKFLRNTLIRNMHEMREIKRAKEQRVDEFSLQKRKSRDIQQLTYQLQQMQERMNSMSNSGDFQDV